MAIMTPERAIQKARKLIQTYYKEHFICIYLDARLKVRYAELIGLGTLDTCIVHPREIFRPAIKRSSASIIVLHNHPSGDVEPSDDDQALTERLCKAGKILGIEVLDHVIFDRGDKHYSFRKNGLIS